MLAHAGHTGDPLGVAPMLLAYLGVVAVGLLVAWLAGRPNADRWPTTPARPVPPRPRGVPRTVSAVRGLGLALTATVAAAALAGPNFSASNLAPIAVHVLGWVGLTVVAALAGDLWSALHPGRTLATWANRRRPPSRRPPQWLDHWLVPTIGLAGYLWWREAWGSGWEPRLVGVGIVVYVGVGAMGGAVWGVAWLDRNDPFSVWFGAVGRLGVLETGPRRRPDRRLGGGDRANSAAVRVRPPVERLAWPGDDARTRGVAVVALGWTLFVALASTPWWVDDVVLTTDGAGRTAFATTALAASIAATCVLFAAACAAVPGRARASTPMGLHLAPILPPLAVGLTAVHTFDTLVVDSQNAMALASDPLGRGWDLFGTISHAPDPTPGVAWAWVGFALVLAAHLAAVAVAWARASTSGIDLPTTRVASPTLMLVAVSLVASQTVLVGTL